MDPLQQQFKKPVNAFIVELTGHGTHYRNLFVFGGKELVIAFVLFADIVECIERTGLVEFVKTDQIGIIEHVDLFELGSGSILRRHHVHAYLAVIENAGIALPHAGCFYNDEIKGCLLTNGNGVSKGSTECRIIIAGSQRAHIGPGMIDGIHPDAIA